MEIRSRLHERYPLDFNTLCRILAGNGSSGAPFPAKIKDVSKTGVGLLSDKYIQPDTVLDFEIPAIALVWPNVLRARIVHATALLGGQWVLGCTLLTPLTQKEMERFFCLEENSPAESTSTPKETPENSLSARELHDKITALETLAVDQVFASCFREENNGNPGFIWDNDPPRQIPPPTQQPIWIGLSRPNPAKR